MKPVSIVVLTKNEKNNIGDCLDSLTHMDYQNYEIIVIDSSTDETPEIVKGYKKARLVRDMEATFASGRNRGIKESKHGIVAFTDADCIIPGDWMKKLLKGFDKETAGVGGGAYPPPNSRYVGVCIASLGFPAGGAMGKEAMGKNLATCNAAFKKSVLKEVGCFDEKYRFGGEDKDLCDRIRKKYKLKYVHGAHIYHKTRTGGKFLGWSFRRGRAKRSDRPNMMNALLPLTAICYPFTSKYRLLIKKRKSIGIGLSTIVFIIPPLYFMKQLFTWFGWLRGN